MTSLVVDYISLTALTPYASNPRSHPKKQVAKIAASIKEFGFVNPLLVDEYGSIIAGHGRYLAAQLLQLTEAPVIRLPGLSETQKKALRISDNKLALESGWSVDLLKVEIEAIAELEVDFDLEVTGFSTGEIDVILNPAASLDGVDDTVPPTPRVARTRTGDIWRLGPHRLGCGDCGEVDFLKSVVGERKVDAAFLDPPYNVKIDGNVSGRGRHREFLMASGEMSDEDFTRFLTERLKACAEVSRDGAVHFVCMDHRHIEHLTSAGAVAYGQRLNICVWNKSNAGMGALYRSRHELIGVFKVGSGPAFNAVELGRHGRNRSNVWDYASANSPRGDRRKDLNLHPTVKPFGLVADAIKDVTRRGGLVLDGFLGSGTTLLAAERTGRIFAGTEIDPLYCDVAIERWMEATGGDAVEERSGRSFRSDAPTVKAA